MDDVVPIFAAIALLCVVIYCLRFLYDYRVREDSIEVLLFRLIPIYRIRIQNIESIDVIGWRELGVGVFTLRLGNRLVLHDMVLIRKRGFIRSIVITPSNPYDFVAQVRR